MPTIDIDGDRIGCEGGDNLRRVLMEARLPVYNGVARAIHCRGLGTCALRVEGPVSDPTPIERWRLSFPPHRAESGLRLACQCRVEGDLRLTKFAGLWGHRGVDPQA